MRKPVVGIIGNSQKLENNRFTTQVVGERNMRAIAEVAGALPLMFAGLSTRSVFPTFPITSTPLPVNVAGPASRQAASILPS